MNAEIIFSYYIRMTIDKIYKFASTIVIKEFSGKFLVVHPEFANWLVFTSEELNIFNALQNGDSIEKVLEKYDESIAVSVITQIEAKHFENPNIKNNKKKEHLYLFDE